MSKNERVLECDVAVIGGGMGGVAAAMAAADEGASVVMSEATDWLGGQMTSQGVSAFDEHAFIETFGGTRLYNELRGSIRAHYLNTYGAPERMPDGLPLNPGNGWVSRLCFEPKVGVRVLDAMLEDHLEAGRITTLLGHTPISAVVKDDRVLEVVLAAGAERTRLRAAYFLDATDLGDLLPLTATAYVTGAESREDTNEPHARPGAALPEEVQGLTYPFALEHRPGEDHTIAKPEGYERFRDAQPYTLRPGGDRGDNGRDTPQYRVFERGPAGEPPFWTYRRIFDGGLLDPAGRRRDIAMINWAGNDFYGGNPIDKPPGERARLLGEAKRLSLGFLYWLQTEAPRDDGKGRGYPGLRLMAEVMGTADGLSKAPYIRESRRIVPVRRVVEGDIAASSHVGARARPFTDSVGLGFYAMDLHSCVGNPEASLYAPTKPFQIPLGALLPQRTKNLIAACKNTGTTHISSGAYRLHPTEWAVGEAAGALAAYCQGLSITPHEVYGDEAKLRRFQYRLLARGMPLFWAVDMPPGHPHFRAAQMLAVAGAITPKSSRFGSLGLQPGGPLDEAGLHGLTRAVQKLLREGAMPAFAPSGTSGTGLADNASRDLTWDEACALIEPHLTEALGGEAVVAVWLESNTTHSSSAE